MKKIFYFALWAVSMFPYGAIAEDIKLGLVTGSEAGTYYQIGQDMSKLAGRHGIALDVYPSQGSIENMVALYDSRSIQLGLAQSDVILFLNLLGDAESKKVAQEIKIVFSLYNEEAHLLASDDIKQIADLQGKKIAIGEAGSGTAMTADVLLTVAEIEPLEKLSIGGTEALEALKRGEIQAMFFIVGYPANLFKEKVSADDQLHLVPIADETITNIFGSTSIIPASTYPWQDEEVETISVRAGLMTLDYDTENVNCGHIRRFAQVIRDNLAWLSENGHEKWKSVDIDAPLDPSLQSACALPAS
jgi:hypothetical protein